MFLGIPCEIPVQMPFMLLTPAERSRLYKERIKLYEPEKYKMQRRKDIERARQKRRSVAELDNAQKNKLRERWRNEKRKQRVKNPPKKIADLDDEEKEKLREQQKYYKQRQKEKPKIKVELDEAQKEELRERWRIQKRSQRSRTTTQEVESSCFEPIFLKEEENLGTNDDHQCHFLDYQG